MDLIFLMLYISAKIDHRFPTIYYVLLSVLALEICMLYLTLVRILYLKVLRLAYLLTLYIWIWWILFQQAHKTKFQSCF